MIKQALLGKESHFKKINNKTMCVRNLKQFLTGRLIGTIFLQLSSDNCEEIPNTNIILCQDEDK